MKASREKRTVQWKTSNQGFSLLELIVTIAIMVIISGGVIYGISSITGYHAKKAAELLYQTVSETKVDAMTKGNGVYMKVYFDSGNYWIKRENGEKTKLGSDKRIIITYVYGGTTEKVKDTPLILSFQKATGAFQPMLEEKADGTLQKTGDYCDKVIVETAAHNRTKELQFYPDTGKCDYHE